MRHRKLVRRASTKHLEFKSTQGALANDSSYDCFPLWLASAVIHECLRVLWPDGAAAATQSQGGKP